MVLIAGIGIGLNGFLNSIVYGLTQEIQNELEKTCCKKKPIEMVSLVNR